MLLMMRGGVGVEAQIGQRRVTHFGQRYDCVCVCLHLCECECLCICVCLGETFAPH